VKTEDRDSKRIPVTLSARESGTQSGNQDYTNFFKILCIFQIYLFYYSHYIGQ
jgi:hypothetical protein